MSSRESYPPALYPFRSASSNRGPGSVPDHPGGSVYVSLPAAGSSSDWSAVEDYEDLPPPPPEWFEPPFQAQPHYQRPVPTVILPPFRAQRPAAWFTQCEDLFRMRGIRDQRDQFALCYGMLGDEQLSQVDASRRCRPPGTAARRPTCRSRGRTGRAGRVCRAS